MGLCVGIRGFVDVGRKRLGLGGRHFDVSLVFYSSEVIYYSEASVTQGSVGSAGP